MDSSHLNSLRKIDQAHHIHPFTNHNQMHQDGSYIITSGKGCWVKDENDRELFDGLAGLWCTNVGYGRQEIIDAVTKQMSNLCFYPSFFNSTTEPSILLAERLAKLAPKRLKHAMFCNSGSESNETALKLIRAYNKIKGRPGKVKILSRTFSYHGVGMASGSITGLVSCTTPFNLPLDGFIHVPAPYAYEFKKESDAVAYGKWCIDETAKIIKEHGADTIAAFFAEPVQGAGGVIPPPEGYLADLRQLCRDNDILFVADEVITGFGRLGDWFASNMWDLDPDILTMAKGITSGYVPLGATMITDEMLDTLNTGGYIAHGFTYSGHPVAAAAAIANLDVLEKEKIIPYVKNDIGPYFQQKLQALKSHPAVGEVRGVALIGAIELLPKEGRDALTPTLNLGWKAFLLGREERIIIRGIRNLVAIAPPLVATREEIDFLFKGIENVLNKLWN
jgi:putrescine aminotransferase